MDASPALVTTVPQLAAIPALPLSAFLLLIFAGRRLGRFSAWVAVAAMAGALTLTAWLFPLVAGGGLPQLQWQWLPASGMPWRIGLQVDPLSWTMLAVVTSVGTLIQVYAIGYMDGDPRFSRFFAYLSLFCASMLGLVLADHFLLFFACWELVGVCSYLLISFWFEKPAAANAGRKAFLTTRVGDTGLLLGILLLMASTGELGFGQLGAVRLRLLAEHREGLLTLVSVLIFFGAVGKSAQAPLHVWLPDAMEGPTPVSALIHAATMVAAGIYLVARTMPLFTPASLSVVLAVGLFTHLMAATVALTMTDLKKALAYSTISQLGLMMTALGLGAVPLAMFHLVTHAWFKALLFLGAGSVIHGTHSQELGEIRGLRRAMPWTAATFLVAALALSGAFPLSGFWSKDAILLQAREHLPWVFWALVVGATMSAGYIFRLYLRCFHGAESPRASHAHESPAVMTAPLVLLACGAATVGWLGAPFTHHAFFGWLGLHEGHEGIAWSLVALSTAIIAVGAGLAWQVSVRGRRLVPASLQPISSRLVASARARYGFDEAYSRWIIQPLLRLAQGLSTFDGVVVDGAVNGAGRLGRAIGTMKDWCDRRLVDGAVNGVAALVTNTSRAGRRLQTGHVRHYLLGAVVSTLVLILVWWR